MKFSAFVLEKNGKYWSRTKAKWLDTPADGCTFASRYEVEVLATTSEVPQETATTYINKDGRLFNVGRDIPYSPPGVVREIIIEVKE